MRIVQPRQAGWVCQSCLAAKDGRKIASRIDSGRIWRRAISSSPIARKNTVQRDGKLPEKPARTRFAPSPTGYMHIGGLRTALFSYLLAKRTGGQFILRIEDTDQKRFVPDAESRLCEDLQWAGVQWDEGPGVGGDYGPYKQSQRNDTYQTHAKRLLEEGSAYRCFCTPQTTGVGSAAYVTSGCYQDCSSLASKKANARAESGNEKFTIRLRRPDYMQKRVYPDLIYGKIKRLKRTPTAGKATEDDGGVDAADTVLLKSDGTPTYHFANVVDDHLMKITHVIRGTEWMASTPLHYDLYHAFGWTPPLFAHVGLLLDKDKAKLSKRNADLALDVRGLRDDHGVLPETLCNFLALQGWSNPNKNDVMSMNDLIKSFDLKFTTGNTMVSMEKLWYLQKHHVQQRIHDAQRRGNTSGLKGIIGKVVAEASDRFPVLKERFTTPEELAAYCADVLSADDKSYQNARQFVDRNWYFFEYDASRVPVAQSSDIAGLPRADVQAFCAQVMSNADFSAPFQPPLFSRAQNDPRLPAVETTTTSTPLEERNKRIHAVLNNQIWARVLPESVDRQDIPLTDQLIDMERYSRHFGGSDSEASTLYGQYKTFQKAVMRFLRERLSCGEPGPSIGVVMAVLGYEECRKRLGVTSESGIGKSW